MVPALNRDVRAAYVVFQAGVFEYYARKLYNDTLIGFRDYPVGLHLQGNYYLYYYQVNTSKCELQLTFIVGLVTF